ncbi:phosphoenolpyruvate--protein phosphotransferase [Agrococcus sp. Marseille-Q4369]|uniref:phosphoenolpyruvate--protein phosphotransferase n=1 Tax=Agrococcus sp. Marseille-Q4369 TaxID=2810513 RepID=UPI001B8B1C9E|nr:phosphoenolpyruvate--protein phosphotransferase [Agrococcus sp. Marseille-Q4369]QUW18518.1 phosphoenolpyruvate--protein phosphotransferase [Agrococcus sp. Marseille-Q4369]
MSALAGVGVGRGIAAAKVLRMPEPLAPPSDEPLAADVDAEHARVQQALAHVADELNARAAAAGGEAQQVLEAAALMAQDPAILDDVRSRLDGGANAERATWDAYAQFREMLTAMGGYMAERATDLDDVAQRVVARLRGVAAPGVPVSDEPFILVARDLAPADTATLDLERTLALVTQEGGPTSHTAILARSKSLPAVVGVVGLLDAAADGQRAIVDARAGTVELDPDDAAVDAALAEREARLAAASAPITAGALADGTEVPLLANVGSPKDAAAAVAAGAEGVGLFRTEFLFLDASSAPSVEQQTASYTELLEAFPGKKVVARVLDAGADKPLAFLNDAHEENPALGLRGIRALRANEAILRDQLTALANADAATDAELWVMAPMIADVEEAEYFVALGRELGLKVVGAMAEVPSIAVVADQVVEACDFVSIGTNDLTQYTLAADRQLGSVAALQDPWHPAVLRLVKMLGDAGARAGKPVGVCGEAAADPALAVVLVGLGVTTLSMSASAIADVRAELLTVTLGQARARAERVLGARSAADARQLAAAVAAG